MSNKILVPTLGESITEATVAKWLKTKGDKVTSDEPIVELETDKVNVEVPSPSNGVLESIAAQEGQTVNVGSLLGVVGANSAGAEKSQLSPQREYNPPKKQTLETDKKIKQKKQHADEPLILNEVENKQETIIRKEKIDNDPLILTEEIKKSPSPFREKKVAPSARKIAEEANINLNQVKGSGKNGLILKGDILALMGEKPEPSERRLAHGPEERIKMTRLRMTIAKRLKEAQENAAMLTTFNEVDMHEVIL